MTSIPFVTPGDPHYGELVHVAPLIRRVTANNPSRFTANGTGTYLIGRGEIAVVDPGPDLDEHRAALERAIGDEQVIGVVGTHSHSDHSPLIAWLAESTGAPTFGVGPHRPSGGEWPAEMWPEFPILDEELAALVEINAKEAIDDTFDPSVRVVNGSTFLRGDGWSLVAVHTPGHASNHLCVAVPELGALFTGDHVMGWSTTVVSPPDGHMGDYLDSLRTVIDRADLTLYPTHGEPIAEPGEFLAAYLAHRVEREAQIATAIGDGLDTLGSIVPALYADVHPALHPAAARSVFAHVIGMIDAGQVRIAGGEPLRPLATFEMVG